jgi:hypothetical protein
MFLSVSMITARAKVLIIYNIKIYKVPEAVIGLLLKAIEIKLILTSRIINS